MRRLSTIVLTAIVALAFADASIVVLALPAIYGRFETTVVGVSWVLTGYAIAVTVAGGLVFTLRRWLHPTALTLGGLLLFAGGSAWCGVAASLTQLMTGRVVQGIGAAALLAGALAVLCDQIGPERGRRWWSTAATVGLAVGPALGGTLTEAFDWQMIFLGQVPAAASGMLVVAVAALWRRARGTGTSTGSAEPDTLTLALGTRTEVLDPAALTIRDRGALLLAHLGYLTLFAGLVGALFLGVLMLVEVWRFGPLHAAVVMMALPAGTLLVSRLTARASRAARIAVGVLCLCAGLLALGYLPAAHPGWAAVALFVCGAGSGMVVAVLAPLAFHPATPLVRAGASVVAAKHAGLVLGLALIAPLLAGSLEDGSERALLAGTGVLLEARLPAQEKIDLAMTVRDAVSGSPRGSVPEVAKSVPPDKRDAQTTALLAEVDARLRATLTRAFRPAFELAAGITLLTLFACGALWGRRHDRPPAAGTAARGVAAATLAMTTLLSAGLLGAEAAAGAGGYGRYAETRPCDAPADPYTGDGLDALIQRIAYSALYGAACELDMSAERLVLALAGQPGFAPVDWDDATVERAIRAAVDRALEDADRRGDLPSWTLMLARQALRLVPLDRIVDLLGLTRD
jgi:MFS family permease